MQGPKVFGILVLLIIGLLVIEHAIVSWSKNEASGVPGAAAPPQGGAPGPSNSTLTHGAQVDTARSFENEVRAARNVAEREFAEVLAAVAKKLPTFKDAQNLTAKEAHGHPRLVTEAAAEMGEIAERLERDPSLRPQGLGFYQACALNPELFRSVRAVCFNRAQLLHAELHQDIWNFDPTKIPKDVIELAKTF